MMKKLRKFIATILISFGLAFAIRTIYRGWIDFYPNQNYIQESPFQELLNISSSLLIIFVPILTGIFLLIRNRKKGKS